MSDLFASQTFVTLEDRPEIVAGYRVAPPVTDSFMPWVTILEQRETVGELRWEFGPDAVLIPVRRIEAPLPQPSRPKGRWRRRQDRAAVRRP